MATNASDNSSSLFSLRFKNIPLAYDKETAKELFTVNIRREKILGLILCAVVIFLLLLDYAASDGWKTSNHVFLEFNILHMMLLLVSAGFLAVSAIHSKMKNSILLSKILHILLNASVLLLCAMIAVRCYIEGKEPYSYTCAMFCIASLILFTMVERIIIFILPCITYAAGVIMNSRDPYSALGFVLFIIMLNALALFISTVQYKSYKSSLLQNRIITSDKEEMGKLRMQAETSLDSRTKFFANISHELRTPLTILYSSQQMLDMMLRVSGMNEQHDEAKKYMQIMRQNILRLVRLIGNLIDITKFEAGYLHANLENSDIVQITSLIAQSVSGYVRDIGITFAYETELEKAVIACDPDKVERILLNLLSNAIKFTDKGGHISVKISRVDDMIQISVKDTGIGIPEEMQKTIFDRFIQADRTITKTGEGSGIGLSLVKALTEMHQGSVVLNSKPGEGSEFIVSFPDKQLPEQKANKEILLSPKQNIDRISYEFSDIYK
jgi:signal transduction histidine kinase